MNIEYRVLADDDCITIKDVLVKKLNISSRLYTKLKRNNYILLNNIPTSPNNNVYENDIVSLYIDYPEDVSNIVPIKGNLDIIYEDDMILAVNKPYNMPVHPSMDHYTDSLSNIVRYYFDSIGLKKKTRPINRLDKDTSGIVLFAKNEYVQENINIKEKIYTAFVYIGNEISKKRIINSPIGRKEGSIIERTCNEKELMKRI